MTAYTVYGLLSLRTKEFSILLVGKYKYSPRGAIMSFVWGGWLVRAVCEVRLVLCLGVHVVEGRILGIFA